ncbi:MAG TPA: hypothetical protein VK009_10255 [Chloroflexota bacterium]|nr:hypothetical protein [Chloroflexota bacterium]
MAAIAAAVVASFLAACVECVEAFTVIMAVGITRGWRSSLLGALAALGVLTVVIAVFGLTLASRIPLPVLRGVIGAFVLVFGLNWLRKAILRYAGIKGLHDEGELFAEHVAELRDQTRVATFDWLGFTVSLKSTLLEGLEVAFIVITFGLSSGKVAESALGALAACLVVGAAGFGLRKPLEKVPENTMKFVVGVMLTTFGTFWAGEGLGVSWPGADLFVVALLVIYLAFSYVAVRVLSAARTSGKRAKELAAAQ